MDSAADGTSEADRVEGVAAKDRVALRLLLLDYSRA